MPIEVRPAGESDIDAVLDIHGVVQGLMATLRPDKVKPTVDPVAGSAFFTSKLRNPRSRLAIATSDGVTVGYVWFDIGMWPESPLMRARSYVLVNNLSVAAAAQRQGVGSALMRYVEQEAAGLGIDEVDVSHWAVNAEAKRFYASLGFSVFMEVLSKKL
jgi:ribosomal protein S18 acetylase RimI-like enzyme